jgi:uncharacterized LabA/DUF88 family protein
LPVLDVNRVSFIIDGFNLYHSARQAQADLGGAGTKWLDLKGLCEGYLYLFGRDAVLTDVFYFSALAHHLEADKPDITARHRAFVECLEASGVRVVLNRFKRKSVWCPRCGERFNRHEEKETDVALAAKLFEVFATDACDTAVLMTGDTDLAPAIRTVEVLFPAKRVAFAFPHGRKNKELKQLAPDSFEISGSQYVKHQLPDPYPLPNGRQVRKPATW